MLNIEVLQMLRNLEKLFHCILVYLILVDQLVQLLLLLTQVLVTIFCLSTWLLLLVLVLGLRISCFVWLFQFFLLRVCYVSRILFIRFLNIICNLLFLLLLHLNSLSFLSFSLFCCKSLSLLQGNRFLFS